MIRNNYGRFTYTVICDDCGHKLREGERYITYEGYNSSETICESHAEDWDLSDVMNFVECGSITELLERLGCALGEE